MYPALTQDLYTKCHLQNLYLKSMSALILSLQEQILTKLLRFTKNKKLRKNKIIGLGKRDNSTTSLQNSSSSKNILSNKKIIKFSKKQNVDYDPFERREYINLGKISTVELKRKAQMREPNRYDISNELYIQYLRFKKENQIED